MASGCRNVAPIQLFVWEIISHPIAPVTSKPGSLVCGRYPFGQLHLKMLLEGIDWRHPEFSYDPYIAV